MEFEELSPVSLIQELQADLQQTKQRLSLLESTAAARRHKSGPSTSRRRDIPLAVKVSILVEKGVHLFFIYNISLQFREKQDVFTVCFAKKMPLSVVGKLQKGEYC